MPWMLLAIVVAVACTPEPVKPAADNAAKPAADNAAKPAANNAAKPAADNAAKPAADNAAKATEPAAPQREGQASPAEPKPGRGVTTGYPAMTRTHYTLEQATAAAVADLQQTLPAARAPAIAVVSARAVTWRDSSLGCPEPGTAYLQVLTPGYLIELSDGPARYRYHASLSGPPRQCPADRAQSPLAEHPDS